MSSKYYHALDELKFTPAEKARMAKRLVAAAEQRAQQEQRRRSAAGADEVAVDVLGKVSSAASGAAQHATSAAQNGATVVPFKKKTKLASRFGLVAASVAAVLIMGTTAAIATGIVRINPSLAAAQIFGSSAKTEIVDKIGHPLGASVSNNGLTLTADSIIGDDYSYAIVFSLTKDDGSAFELSANEYGVLPLNFDEEDITPHASFINVGLGLHSSYGSSYFYDADPDDNAIQYVVQTSFDSKVTGEMMNVHLKDLMYGVDEDERTSLQPGSWDLSFKVDYESSGHALKQTSSFSYNGHHAELIEGSLSPVALSLTFTTDDRMDDVESSQDGIRVSSGQMPEKMNAQFESYLEIPVEITLTSGEAISFTSAGGGTVESKSAQQQIQTAIWLPEIIDVDEVASVKVGETVIPLV